MSSQCDVIITYCWNRVGYTILKSLYRKGLNVWVADTSKHNICSMSKYCAGSFCYPNPFSEEEEFIKVLKEKINELAPKVLIPTHDESIVIMRHKHEFPDNLIIPYDNADKLIMLSDKAKSAKVALQAGVPIPIIYSSIDEIKKYPIVFKTVIGNSAKGVFFPKSKSELLALMKSHRNESTLIQQKIGGSDYSVDCVRWDGFWQASVYHAIVTKTDGGGTTTQRGIVEAPNLERYAKLILDSVDFKGVCGLDFRFDSTTGEVAYIETNARFTGGLATPVAAGFDIPWIIYKLATDGCYEEPCNAKIGIKTKWILGDIITLIGRLAKFSFHKEEFMQVLKFKGFDSFDDFSSDDKSAILGEMYYYLVKLLKNGKLNP